MIKKRIIVGIIGSGIESHENLSVPLGQWVAKNGFHMVNGGGGGVMESAAKAFSNILGREGLVLGIIPSHYPCDLAVNRKNYQFSPGYPNPYIDLSIQTHLHMSGVQGKKVASRNHIVILTANILVALPGGPGTRSEIELALEYGKPLVVLSPNDEWKEFESTGAIITKQMEDVFEEIKKIYD